MAQKSNSAFMKPLAPSAKLAAIVGTKSLPRSQAIKKTWEYIKKHGLQDKKNRRMINADAALTLLFNGKKQVSMFELASLISKNLK
ncbi:MAG: SWIB/MDM2 domain-containing protein [Mycoplasmataceae bacterium]|nr:SWIB/MDM2 domain-containing protein [Mycoplasmataceae bacterium]